MNDFLALVNCLHSMIIIDNRYILIQPQYNADFNTPPVNQPIPIQAIMPCMALY